MPNLKITATVSIVVPFHNEEPNVIELYGRLQGIMEELGCDYQFVFVDDGSTDHTYKLLKELTEIDHHVIAVRLRRNFGQTGALAAGFAHSTGE
jgi:glycosyltransferase involved in cell wall biosynthesis